MLTIYKHGDGWVVLQKVDKTSPFTTAAEIVRKEYAAKAGSGPAIIVGH